MKKTLLLEVLCTLFALLFLYTGLNKIVDNEVFRAALQKSPLLHIFTPVLSVFIPAAELLIAFGLFINRFRRIALYSFLVMMAAFTIYISFMLYFRSERPCTCGGIIKYMNWHQHFYFNSLFTLLTGLAIWLHRKMQHPNIEMSRTMSYIASRS